MSARFTWPWVGVYPVTQPFGPTSYAGEVAGYGYPHFHDGVDAGVPSGTELIAPCDGLITWAGWSADGYGLAVGIQHDSGCYVWMGHMSRVDVAAGGRIRKGQHLGLSGSTGNSTGPHVHVGAHYGHWPVPYDALVNE
jgi:murein DD-endopeptidase MepM/ murein hydrolase activator NlpD